MFKIEFSPLPEFNYPERCKNKLVIIIDTLRATSTIATALANNANCVVPVLDTNQAFLEYDKSPETTILCGEQGCVKINNFHFGNSPIELNSKDVEGKKVIIYTTNGTKLFHISSNAKEIICGSLINAKAVAEYIFNSNSDCLLSCAGTDGSPTDEDNFTAGYIASELQKLTNQFECDKDMLAMMLISNIFTGNVFDYISKTRHAERLISLGFSQDVKFCSQTNLYNIVPRYVNGKIIR